MVCVSLSEFIRKNNLEALRLNILDALSDGEWKSRTEVWEILEEYRVPLLINHEEFNDVLDSLISKRFVLERYTLGFSEVKLPLADEAALPLAA